MGKRVPMNEEQLKGWVLMMLGAPRLTTEFDRCHLDVIYNDALDWFSAYKGIVRGTLIYVNPGQVAYDAPEDTDVVVNVIEPTPPYDLGIIFSPWTVLDGTIPYDVLNASPESLGVYSTFAQAIQYSNIAQKVLSAEWNWMFDEPRKKIILSPNPRRSGYMGVEYKSNCLDPSELSFHDHEMLKKYMLALAKEILGRIRSRWGDEFMSAEGPRQNDGRALLEEAFAAKEKLTEELRQSTYPYLIIQG